MGDSVHYYKAIVLGASAGGMEVVNQLAVSLPEDFSIPVLIVQHIADTSDGEWANILNGRCRVTVKEADEKERIKPGTVYFAPANYHLLLEPDLTLTLTIDERVNYARPAIDVLFETAAESCGDRVIGIICTGGNSDGARGLMQISEKGGLTIVQSPESSEVSSMPLSAIQLADPQYILPPAEILSLLLTIHENKTRHDMDT
jgi:two-component system, chemotaxis family, protein-glutamate methylesterase/glutaminase